MLKKGDPCYVRHNGKIKEAIYIEPSNIPKCHRVTIKGKEHDYLLASNFKSVFGSYCRFVCMTGINGKDNG